MKTLLGLVGKLARADARSVLLVSGQVPKLITAAGSENLGDEELTTDALLRLLFAAGGSRYLESLSSKPSTWTMRAEGLGNVRVSVVQRGVFIEAELTAPGREGPQRTLSTGAAKKARMGVPTPIKALDTPIKRSLTPKPSRPSGRLRAVTADVQREEEAREALRPRRSEPRREAVRPLSTSNSSPRNQAVEAPKPQPAPPPPPSSNSSRSRSVPPAQRASAPPPPPSTDRPFTPSPQLAKLLQAAREHGASDLHLVAGRPPLFRVAGDLTARGDALPRSTLEEMLRAAVPSRLAPTFEKQGSIDFALELPRYGRFRVNLGRQRTGWKACFRLIPLEVPTIESLGLPPELEKALEHHQGLIVITGPSGHGKTTTLAALVDRLITTRAHHVITVEDPIEHVHTKKRALLSQREVGTHTRSFLTALKGSLREDPDVIVVGELRDRETVRMALSASETGHLVLGTMNTPSAARTIDRLIDLFPPDEQAQVRTTLAGGLRMIVSQRLLPSADRTKRHVAVELLPGSIALWNLIRENKTFQIPSLMQRGKGAGVLRLQDAVAELVRTGKVAKADGQPLMGDLDEATGKPAVPEPPGSSPERPPQSPLGAPLHAHAEPPPTPRHVPDEPPPPDGEPKGIFDRLFRKGR